MRPISGSATVVYYESGKRWCLMLQLFSNMYTHVGVSMGRLTQPTPITNERPIFAITIYILYIYTTFFFQKILDQRLNDTW